MQIIVNGDLTPEEVEAYKARAIAMYSGKIIDKMTLTPAGSYIDIAYEWRTMPFERIRRITGYLVGTLDRWNDGKKAEESDRVKHES